QCAAIQTAAVIHCCSFCLGAAPTCRDASSPPLKIIRVGIDMTPYFDAVCGFSSTFSLTILTLLPIAPAISSSAGAIMRHGPYQHSLDRPSGIKRCDDCPVQSHLAEVSPWGVCCQQRRCLIRLEVGDQNLARTDHEAVDLAGDQQRQLTSPADAANDRDLGA